MDAESLPVPFVKRRVHSIAGLWLSLFLFQHLLTNSQAALFFGDDGQGFIETANSIHSLPYLSIIELLLLALPILVHTAWGIQYIRQAKYNSFPSDGTRPALPEYPRNRAYTWQRITAWILVVGIVAHVVQMRFVEAPEVVYQGTHNHYLLRIHEDEGIHTLAQRLGVTLLSQDAIHREIEKNEKFPSPDKDETLYAQQLGFTKNWTSALKKASLKPGEILAVSPDFGTAELLLVRETFKMPVMLVLYTLFVLASCFHGFNGLWTFLISWGVTISPHSQNVMRTFATFLMILVSCMGLVAIWGTYWINLKA